LVVIGIIAILIAILLPALGRARKQAQTVQCASNLRQLYTMTMLYTNMYNSYTMPARIWSGSAKDNYWCGINVLGPLMGVRRIGTSAQSQIDTLDRIQKILRCPSSNRGPDPSNIFAVDYTYNTNLGDDRSIRLLADGTNNPSYSASYAPWAQFKKRNQVPGSVVVALDATDLISSDTDYQRFGSLGDLTTANATRPYPRAGHPHQQNKANALFHDGSVILLMAFSPRNGNIVPTTFDPLTTKLENWMILSPGNLDSTATYFGSSQGKPENVWSKGRPLPNFN
jgi:prepilin-type processing-associated H-X9-DG protein